MGYADNRRGGRPAAARPPTRTGCWWPVTSARWPRRSSATLAAAAQPVRHRGLGARQPRAVVAQVRPADAARRVPLPAPGRRSAATSGCSPRRIPYPVWTGAGGPVTVAPLFLLYDYTFRPPGAHTQEEALEVAYRSGIVCTDEQLLHPDPYPEPGGLVPGPGGATPCGGWPSAIPALPTVLVNHFPLTRLPTLVLRYPRVRPVVRHRADRRLAPALPRPARWSTATCTSRAPPSRTASGSRRSRWAIPASGRPRSQPKQWPRQILPGDRRDRRGPAAGLGAGRRHHRRRLRGRAVARRAGGARQGGAQAAGRVRHRPGLRPGGAGPARRAAGPDPAR